MNSQAFNRSVNKFLEEQGFWSIRWTTEYLKFQFGQDTSVRFFDALFLMSHDETIGAYMRLNGVLQYNFERTEAYIYIAQVQHIYRYLDGKWESQ